MNENLLGLLINSSWAWFLFPAALLIGGTVLMNGQKRSFKKGLKRIQATVVKRTRALINGKETYEVELEFQRQTADGKSITKRTSRTVSAQIYAAINSSDTINLWYDQRYPNQPPALDLTTLRQL